MAFDWLTPYFAYGFFVQLGAAFVLASGIARLPRFPAGILAALFVCNAIGTAANFGILHTQPDDMFVVLGRAFDTPTSMLIFAYVAARNDSLWGRRIAWGVLAVAGIGFYLYQPWFWAPRATGTLAVWQEYAQLHTGAALFHISVLVAVVAMARGDRVERWIALALAARFLYWATHSWAASGYSDAFVRTFSAATSEWDRVHALQDLVLLVGLPVMIVALVVLLRGREAPPLMVGLAIIAIGPLTASVSIFSNWRDPWLQITANLFTVILLRPFLFIGVLAPRRLGVVFTRALMPAALFSFLWMVEGSFGTELGQREVGMLIGLIVSLSAFAAMESIWPRLTGREDRGVLGLFAGSTDPPDDDNAPVGQNGEAPQWARVLAALEGSEAEVRPTPLFGWTQQGIAEATAISVKRVSEVPTLLNERAERYLDRWVPDWREETSEVPMLVTKHRGAIEGVAGPRVYYRLTVWGERLRERVLEDETPQILSVARTAGSPAGT